MTALNNLVKLTNSMALITQQLATGSMLNHGSDNPAALIAAEQIRDELTAIEAASRNDTNAHNMINVADSAMAQVGDLSKANEIVQAAENQVAQDRARLGAFDKYVVNSSKAVLDGMQITLSSSLSQIADTDMAQSMSSLIRNEILAHASFQALANANRNRGTILQLLNS